MFGSILSNWTNSTYVAYKISDADMSCAAIGQPLFPYAHTTKTECYSILLKTL